MNGWTFGVIFLGAGVVLAALAEWVRSLGRKHE